MKRRKKIIRRNTRIIKRNEKPVFIPPFKNVGGHLPYPPDTCLKKEFWTTRFDVIWIDLSICHNCQDIKICYTRQEYLAYLKNQTKQLIKPPSKEKIND